MNQRRLGRSGLTVSEICLGTMTFGLQADEAMAHQMMDAAFDRGVNFLDCAEIYPVPPSAKRFGVTETIVGNWLASRPRESVILATKITGPTLGWFTAPIRHGMCALDRHQIIRSVEDSLKRLQTDYIDLYQTHWPDHHMRQEDTLSALTELIKSGKVRAIGCSNETSWGLMKNLWASEKHNLARFDTIQNNFSLINRRCESELAQVCRQEQVSLLPYSPLGGGVLTGKYNDGARPKGARFTDYLKHGMPRQKAMAERFVNPRSTETAKRLGAIADDLGIDLVTLATAWSKQHDFVASTIIGASHIDQLAPALDAADLTLSPETLARIDTLDAAIPNPMTEDGLRRL